MSEVRRKPRRRSADEKVYRPITDPGFARTLLPIVLLALLLIAGVVLLVRGLS